MIEVAGNGAAEEAAGKVAFHAAAALSG